LKRKVSIRALIVCSLILGCAEGEEEHSDARELVSPPKSMILISLDTFRADRVGRHRGGRSITPAMDRLAADSVLFERCYAQAPSTLPSHASIMTSLLPPQHGAYYSIKSKLAPDVVTIAEILSQAGYRTASFNGGAQMDAVWGLDRGFDLYDSDVPDRETEIGIVEDQRLMLGVAKTIQWLEKNDARPFFVFLHSYEVHAPYTPELVDVEALGVERSERDRKRTSHEPLSTAKDSQRSPMETLRVEIIEGDAPLDETARQQFEDLYDAEVISADRALGHLISTLDEMDLYADTLIVFTSDHGEEFGEHGMLGHSHTLYDELLHVPLIIKFPGSQFAGTRVATQVRSLDIAPTALRSIGIKPPSQFLGRDLSSRAKEGWEWDLPAPSYQDSDSTIALQYRSLRTRS
jgi:arylsulfatase A-like enzyme